MNEYKAQSDDTIFLSMQSILVLNHLSSIRFVKTQFNTNKMRCMCCMLDSPNVHTICHQVSRMRREPYLYDAIDQFFPCHHVLDSFAFAETMRSFIFLISGTCRHISKLRMENECIRHSYVSHFVVWHSSPSPPSEPSQRHMIRSVVQLTNREYLSYIYYMQMKMKMKCTTGTMASFTVAPHDM